MIAHPVAQTALLIVATAAPPQASSLIVHPGVKLPNERDHGPSLITSLERFLDAAALAREDNEWVHPPQRLQTAVLLDELKDIGARGEGRERVVCRPNLLNVVPLADRQYFVQVAYIGTEDGVPFVEANVELIAHPHDRGYLFCSPLSRNTRDWNVLQLGNITFHSPDAIDEGKAREYHRLTSSFDGKLGSVPKQIAFYFFDDDLGVQHAMGLPYRLEHNGQGGCSRWSATCADGEAHLMSMGEFASFDPHDLWHDRLTRVRARDEVNRAVDEGIATLYGGSWGLTWSEMFAAFREKIDVGEHTDWLDLRARKVMFETRGHQNPTDFMINALLVKRIEAERGFSGVWTLLNAMGDEAYFEALAKLTGITRQNYNGRVWDLVREEVQLQDE